MSTINRALQLLLLLLSLTMAAWAQPAIVVLTNSKDSAVQARAGEAKHWLGKLRQANKLEDFQLPVTAVDLANRSTADEWQKRFGVTTADLPALGYVTKQGNTITDLGLLLNKFADARQAAQSAFKFAQTKDSAVRVTEIQTLLSITSVPEGAAVFIGGQEVAVTPAVELPVSPGSLAIELRHPDCQPYRAALTVGLGDNKSVGAQLEVLPGRSTSRWTTPCRSFSRARTLPAPPP